MSRPRWLTRREQRAWRAFVDMQHRLVGRVARDLQRETGLSGADYEVLVQLSEAPDRRLRMCDLAARMHLSPSGLTRRLDGIVKLGFVVREPAADDRRVTLAVLTDDGFAALERAAPLHVDGVRRHLLDHMNREQVRAVGAALAAVRAGRAATAAGQAEKMCRGEAAAVTPAAARS